MLDFLRSRSNGSYLEMAHITIGDQNFLFITVGDISPDAQELRELQIVLKDTVTLESLWGFCCVCGVMLHFGIWLFFKFSPSLFVRFLCPVFSNLESHTWISID